MAEIHADAHPMRARLDAALEHALDESRIVGAVVIAMHDGRIVYRRAAGLADREAGTPMRVDTLFRLASVTKPIVSTAAMALAAAGRLDLDDGVERWLPEFRPLRRGGVPAHITARHLLSHTAGLGYRFLEARENGPYARAGVSDGMDRVPYSLIENVRRIATVPLLFAPGSAWCYSVATDVLGALIERVCDCPLGDAVAELVTRPLSMTDTAFVARDPARLATPYVSDAPVPRRMGAFDCVPPFDGVVGIRFEPARATDPDAYPSGGGGMVGTADDVISFLDTLRSGGGAVLPAASVDEMGRLQPGAESIEGEPGFGFGLGFSVLRDPVAAGSPESPGTWRWGGAYGHAWFVDRTAGLSVVALTNTLYEGMRGRFVTDVRDAVYGVA